MVTSPLGAIFANQAVANIYIYIILYIQYTIVTILHKIHVIGLTIIFIKNVHMFNKLSITVQRKFLTGAFPAITELGKRTIIIIITVNF